MDWYTNLMGGAGYNMYDAYGSGELWGYPSPSAPATPSTAGFWGDLVGGFLGVGKGKSPTSPGLFTNDDGSTNWGQALGGLLSGVGQGALGYVAKDRLSESDLKRAMELERLRAEQARELYSHQLAEQERYRQMQGEQLAGAMSNYSQFAGTQANPYAALSNAPSPFNMQMPQGLLSYGF